MERKSAAERRREREKKLSTFVWASRRTSLHPKKTRAIAGPTAKHLMDLFSVPKLKTGHQLVLSVTVQIKTHCLTTYIKTPDGRLTLTFAAVHVV